ncbi:hypothetical protein N6P31_03295 [Pectobacterium betavasculorum]|uniref:Transporter n=1 Tax=Pectobacterium betavasculorum TaxID=55207 RepID=A0ABR4V3V3_9GAMM|nr:hypothetical protein [Pectobacterium betavasculorum]KFX22063.1 hypothetical protein JV35_02580 [Pectobacterium betavasculorum]
MDNPPESTSSSEPLCLDYTDYLAALCNKRWRFVDAMYGVMPIFGMVTKMAAARQSAPKERLKVLALQVLSTQVSDETNIIRLITLARQQGLTAFDIQLPYALTSEQLNAIGNECDEVLDLTLRDERLSVRFKMPAVQH